MCCGKPWDASPRRQRSIWRCRGPRRSCCRSRHRALRFRRAGPVGAGWSPVRFPLNRRRDWRARAACAASRCRAAESGSRGRLGAGRAERWKRPQWRGGYGSVNSGFADGYYGANSNPFPSSNLLPPARVIRGPMEEFLSPCEQLRRDMVGAEDFADACAIFGLLSAPFGPQGVAAATILGGSAVLMNRKARGFARELDALGCGI